MEVLSHQALEQQRLQEVLQLDISAEKLRGIDTALGPRGIGSFVVRNVLDPDQLEIMHQEIFDPHKVTWRDNHINFTNESGNHIVQNHTVVALKMNRGDRSFVDKVPHMEALATNIQKFVRGLSGIFPALHGWQADEMSMHRYDSDLGLSFHRDNWRFTGLIGVLTLEGESDVLIEDADKNVHVLPQNPGDLNLTRATLLYESYDADGRPEKLCPKHEVANLRTPHRTSFIVRDNIIPQFAVQGFHYDNWEGEPYPKRYMSEVLWPAKVRA